MDLSIVTTMYRSAPHLREFYGRVIAAAQRITGDYELVLVDDGSPDDSLEVALSLHRADRRVRVVDLSRNFGHHKAIMAGLAHARGDLVFLIDCDLEEEPEWLEQFHQVLKETGDDVVYGVQARRKGRLLERTSGYLFYKLFNLLSPQRIPENLLTVRLMSRRYVRSLLEHREREIFLGALCAATGFRQSPIKMCKKSRGTTTYTLARRISLFVCAITSFSDKPLVWVFYLGTVISALSGMAAICLVVRHLFFGVLLQGWPSLIISIWLLGGLTIFCVGMIGIYLSRVFVEVKQRPYVIVRELHEHASAEPAGATGIPSTSR
ncbi:MAG: glycosyltransferase family 2 protein [Capsulimonadaceae bacterium]